MASGRLKVFLPLNNCKIPVALETEVCGFESSLADKCVEVLSTAQPRCSKSDVTVQRLEAVAAHR